MFTIIDSIICPLIKIIGLTSCTTSKWISLSICILLVLLILLKIFRR